jgi:hypothetical protein
MADQKRTSSTRSKKPPASRKKTDGPVDDFLDLSEDIVQLARLGLAGRDQDFQLYLQRLSRRLRTTHPSLAREILTLVRQAPTRSSPLRDAAAGVVQPAPVDTDSRLDLLRHEFITDLPARPIWDAAVSESIDQLVRERGAWDRLAEAGLLPTRTALLVGPPGVGKTLAARFIAYKLDLPLLVLDLAAVMSSLLGRTGTNLRHVMDYAKSRPCILLLDELDAVAKRRDDVGDVGELKRLVTVLLQAVDDWPSSGLLLAATNHPDLLDPAAWRRFEMIVEFALPDADQIHAAVAQFLLPGEDVPRPLTSAIEELLRGSSFSDIESAMLGIRRRSALGDEPIAAEVERYVTTRAADLPLALRAAAAADAVERGVMSQHRAHELFGVSRDVIRRTSIERRNLEHPRANG